jgi:hypothetical protein
VPVAAAVGGGQRRGDADGAVGRVGVEVDVPGARRRESIVQVSSLPLPRERQS